MKLVLDTHIWVWLMLGDDSLTGSLRQDIEQSANSGDLLVPAISVWEVAMLENKGRLIFKTSASQWVKQALISPGLRLAPLTPEIAVESCHLPGAFHGDPADRMIVATARLEEAILVTRDKKILNYAKQGHVNTL